MRPKQGEQANSREVGVAVAAYGKLIAKPHKLLCGICPNIVEHMFITTRYVKTWKSVMRATKALFQL
jgi:hypothetical protein